MPLSQYQTGRHVLRLWVFWFLSWHTVELWAVNMKHYPSSSGVLRGEGYAAMRAWKTIQESITLFCRREVSACVGLGRNCAIRLNSDSEPEALHSSLSAVSAVHFGANTLWSLLIQVTLSSPFSTVQRFGFHFKHRTLTVLHRCFSYLNSCEWRINLSCVSAQWVVLFSLSWKG